MSLQPNALAAMLETEMANVYQELRQTPLPAAGAEDRRLLFLSIARGLLRYLEANQQTVIKRITLRETVGVPTPETYDVTGLDLNIVL